MKNKHSFMSVFIFYIIDFLLIIVYNIIKEKYEYIKTEVKIMRYYDTEEFQEVYDYFGVANLKELAQKLNHTRPALRYRLESWLKHKFPLNFLCVKGELRPLKDSDGKWYKNISEVAEKYNVRYYNVTTARNESGIIDLGILGDIVARRQEREKIERERKLNACI